jgi:hypothetical protein
MLKWFVGKRTYFCAAIIFILGGCKALGWIDDSLFQALVALVGGLGLAALRAVK